MIRYTQPSDGTRAVANHHLNLLPSPDQHKLQKIWFWFQTGLDLDKVQRMKESFYPEIKEGNDNIEIENIAQSPEMRMGIASTNFALQLEAYYVDKYFSNGRVTNLNPSTEEDVTQIGGRSDQTRINDFLQHRVLLRLDNPLCAAYDAVTGDNSINRYHRMIFGSELDNTSPQRLTNIFLERILNKHTSEEGFDLDKALPEFVHNPVYERALLKKRLVPLAAVIGTVATFFFLHQIQFVQLRE